MMSILVKMAAALSLLAAAPAYAADRSPEQVVKDHVASMKSADVDKVMSDYADDTVVITPPGLVPGQTLANAPGVYSGKANARKVFVVLTGKDSIEGIRAMETIVEPLGGDVALLRWMQFRGTPKQVSGIDVFVVRGDRIVVQDIVLDPAKP
jgi:ketosteroid isomerase-like protein